MKICQAHELHKGGGDVSPSHFFSVNLMGAASKAFDFEVSVPTNRPSVAKLLAELPGEYQGARREANSHEGIHTARRAPCKEEGYSGSPTRAARINR